MAADREVAGIARSVIGGVRVALGRAWDGGRSGGQAALGGVWTVVGFTQILLPTELLVCKSRNCLAGFNGIVWQVQVL